MRWLARLGSLASLGVLLLFMIGEGFNPIEMTARELELCAFFPLGVAFGLILAWRWESLGGAVALGSLAGFYVVHWLTASGFPRGWAFLVFAAPGAFFLLAWLLAHARQQSAA